MPPPRGVAGRLDRALRNFMETFALFADVLAAHVSDTHNAFTERGAALPLGSRRLRAPLCCRGPAAPFAWNLATLGIVLLVVALLLGWWRKLYEPKSASSKESKP